MKQYVLAFLITAIPFFSFAQSENTFRFSEIGWSFTPPSDFILLDSSTNTIKVTEDLTIWKKTIFLKSNQNRANTIACSISKDQQSEEEWRKMRPVEIKRSYEILSKKYPTLEFDSLTTKVVIDGVAFQKFAMLGKGNEQTGYNHVQLTSSINGYKVHFIYIFEDALAGSTIDKQFLASKFEK